MLGVASATSVNKLAITAPATSATLTIDDGFALHVTGDVTALSGAHTGSSSGTNTGDQTSVTGNAGTATALQTARAINGVDFDGTAAITVAAAAGTLTGAMLASNVLASSLTSVGTLTGLTVTSPTVTGSSAPVQSLAQTWNTGSSVIGIAWNFTDTASGASTAALDVKVNGAPICTLTKVGTMTIAGVLSATGGGSTRPAQAPPAGGATTAGYKFSSTANFGVFFGSGAPTVACAQGSLYLRSDGSTNLTRLYQATDSVGGWTAVPTAS